MRFPHSRWNEVREDALTSSGYSVLTKSAEAGVNLFVKKKKKSLFVHFQGHPEYGARTLWKEYRRDIKRFLRRERPTYPKMPHGYFGSTVTRALDEFRETALSHPSEERLAEFPEVDMGDGLESVWRSPAARVYGNWLQYVVARRARTTWCLCGFRIGVGFPLTGRDSLAYKGECRQVQNGLACIASF